MGHQTPFYQQHLASGAKIVDFAGWDMPLHYGSQIKEHLAVRKAVGMFDVSHMGVVDLHGADVKPYLRRLLANNIDKLVPGKALYTCMLNDKGGVIDDLIVYKFNDDFYRVVINAGTRVKDIAWMREQADKYQVKITERNDLAMLAVQGPEAKQKIAAILPANDVPAVLALKPFHFLELHDASNQPSHSLFIARTGYTGEDGFEIILEAFSAATLWQKLLQAGVTPSGLGARDTLRLEAGLNLYGNDMDENVSPLESNLAWTVAMEPKERSFIGRSALEIQAKEGIKNHLVGLVLEGPGIMRHHQKVILHDGSEGEITSGGYSPTMGKSIALARIPNRDDTNISVEIRDKRVNARIVKPPFVSRGK